MDRNSALKALENLSSFMEEEAEFFLGPEKIHEYRSRLADIIESAKAPPDAVYIGLAGGTGVGKSTLINAIAGSEISKSSHRRPYTDRAVVYRHVEKERGLEGLAGSIQETDPTHEIDMIRDLILIDLPDFDSIEETHKEVVQSFMPVLDCIVWVVGPKKYADGVFYKMLNMTHKHQENFTFVLNKADELLRENDEDPLKDVREALGAFTMRLKQEANIDSPRVFCLSARDSLLGKTQVPFLENEFAGLINYLMIKRDKKDIESLKASNVAEASEKLLREIRRDVAPKERIRRIKAMVEEAGVDGSELETLEKGLPPGDVDDLSRMILNRLSFHDASIPVVRFAQGLILRIGGKRQGDLLPNGLERTFNGIAESMGSRIGPRVETSIFRLDSDLLMAFEKIEGPDASRLISAELSEAAKNVELWLIKRVELESAKLQGFRSWFRRIWQRFILMIPPAALLLKLAERENLSLSGLSANIAVMGEFILELLKSLFSPEALSGIYVLLIIEILLIIHMAMSRNRRLEKSAARIAESTIDELYSEYRATENKIRSNRFKTLARLEKGLDKIERAGETITTH